MLKIWGRISSINVRKVVLTAQLLQVRTQEPFPSFNLASPTFSDPEHDNPLEHPH